MEIEDTQENLEQEVTAEETDTSTVEESTETSDENADSSLGEEGGDENAEEETAEGEEGEEAAAAGAEGEEEGEGDEPAFKPNTKVKVGKWDPATRSFTQQELEIDPKFHPLMKTPEDEKMIRELHEKAYGLDTVKARFAEEKHISNTFQNHYKSLKNIYQSAVKPGGNILRMDKWFKEIDVPQEVVLRWAAEKVRLHQLQAENPEQHALELSRLSNSELAEERQQNSDFLAQQNQETLRQNKELQIELTLKNPELAPLVAKYESLTQKPGSFRDAIVMMGNQVWMLEKRDISAAEAAQLVIQQFGIKADAAPAPQGQGKAPAASSGSAQQPGQQIAKKKVAKTIPNLQGGSASPLPAKPKSLEEIKKYRKQVHGF